MLDDMNTIGVCPTGRLYHGKANMVQSSCWTTPIMFIDNHKTSLKNKDVLQAYCIHPYMLTGQLKPQLVLTSTFDENF